MKRILIIIAVTATVLAATRFYRQQVVRYNAEEDALDQIAAITQGRVKYVRMEGFSGIRFVNTVWLPKTELSDQSVRDIGRHFESLPRLDTVIVDSGFASHVALSELRMQHPQVFFGTSVGFSGKPQFQFADTPVE